MFVSFVCGEQKVGSKRWSIPAALAHPVRKQKHVSEDDIQCAIFTHVVLEVVPLHVVGQVADVDAAVLLR